VRPVLILLVPQHRKAERGVTMSQDRGVEDPVQDSYYEEIGIDIDGWTWNVLDAAPIDGAELAARGRTDGYLSLSNGAK